MAAVVNPCILVAHHKPYRMPADGAYLPFDVTRASLDHRHWCELTALHEAWKGSVASGADAIGLVHYRRHFRGASGAELSGGEVCAALDSADVILPRMRNYWIETNYSQFVHAHPAEGLVRAREIIARRHAADGPEFDRVMQLTKGHRFNMFIMRRAVFEDYCAWLFDILFELERTVDLSGYSAYDARLFGFVAERLEDVWINRAIATGALRVREFKVLNLESQHWPTKILNFLKRKFGLA